MLHFNENQVFLCPDRFLGPWTIISAHWSSQGVATVAFRNLDDDTIRVGLGRISDLPLGTKLDSVPPHRAALTDAVMLEGGAALDRFLPAFVLVDRLNWPQEHPRYTVGTPDERFPVLEDLDVGRVRFNAWRCPEPVRPPRLAPQWRRLGHLPLIPRLAFWLSARLAKA